MGNVEELEDEIISKLKRRSLDDAIKWLEQMKQTIIAAKKGHSIVIYLHCITHDTLLQLIDQLKTDRLKGIIERVLIELLSIGDALRVTLTWSLEEFKKAATYFG